MAEGQAPIKSPGQTNGQGAFGEMGAKRPSFRGMVWISRSATAFLASDDFIGSEAKSSDLFLQLLQSLVSALSDQCSDLAVKRTKFVKG